MLHTASFYQHQYWVGAPFRVSRLHPRGQKVQWQSLPFFYPSAELVKALRSGKVDFEFFSRSYRALLEERYAANDLMKRWVAEAPGLGDFTLLCFERDNAPCHRRVLARWLKEKDPELELGRLR